MTWDLGVVTGPHLECGHLPFGTDQVVRDLPSRLSETTSTHHAHPSACALGTASSGPSWWGPGPPGSLEAGQASSPPRELLLDEGSGKDLPCSLLIDVDPLEKTSVKLPLNSEDWVALAFALWVRRERDEVEAPDQTIYLPQHNRSAKRAVLTLGATLWANGRRQCHLSPSTSGQHKGRSDLEALEPPELGRSRSTSTFVLSLLSAEDELALNEAGSAR